MQETEMTHSERQQFNNLESRVGDMEKKINSILNIVKGIAIGLAIGALVFGFISIKDLVSVAK